MSWAVLAGAGLALLAWYGIGAAWASSVARHQPELRDSVQGGRYGWRCPRCGSVQAPACRVRGCGGPLVWVQRGTRVMCTRCHRNLVAHPMLFRQAPTAWPARCRRCGWMGVVREWKVG